MPIFFFHEHIILERKIKSCLFVPVRNNFSANYSKVSLEAIFCMRGHDEAPKLQLFQNVA